MLSIVYSSRATPQFQAEDLRALLRQSRRDNEEGGITGMLLFRSGYFLQVLEGPDDIVRGRMAVIEADDRHSDVKELIAEDITERLFPEWTMAYEELDLDSADQVPGLRTTFDDLTKDRTSTATLRAVRASIAWYRQRAG